MTRWRLVTTPAFERSVRRLGVDVQRRVRDYLNDLRLLEDPRVRGKPLRGPESGLWRYRIGDYRVITVIEDDLFVIVAIKLGHRSQVYRK